MKAWLKKQGLQASTWRGLVLLLTALGVALSSEQSEAIIAGGLAVTGLVGAVVSDG